MRLTPVSKTQKQLQKSSRCYHLHQMQRKNRSCRPKAGNNNYLSYSRRRPFKSLFWSDVSLPIWLNITTDFVDTRLWKTKRSQTFPKFLSVLRVIDRSDRNPLITATSVTFWPLIRSVDNRLTEILETFPRMFCFPKSLINENSGHYHFMQFTDTKAIEDSFHLHTN